MKKWVGKVPLLIKAKGMNGKNSWYANTNYDTFGITTLTRRKITYAAIEKYIFLEST
jgi:hypothetical protein